jgi:hypothetical protein
MALSNSPSWTGSNVSITSRYGWFQLSHSPSVT